MSAAVVTVQITQICTVIGLSERAGMAPRLMGYGAQLTLIR